MDYMSLNIYVVWLTIGGLLVQINRGVVLLQLATLFLVPLSDLALALKSCPQFDHCSRNIT
jgi:hypothetical protein